MLKRETLTLKKPPDPAKAALSERIGRRFIDRKGRYILQERLIENGESTWVDIPLVPEVYG